MFEVTILYVRSCNSSLDNILPCFYMYLKFLWHILELRLLSFDCVSCLKLEWTTQFEVSSGRKVSVAVCATVLFLSHFGFTLIFFLIPGLNGQVFGDPEAADIVFTCGADLVAVGINVTHQVVMTGTFSVILCHLCRWSCNRTVSTIYLLHACMRISYAMLLNYPLIVLVNNMNTILQTIFLVVLCILQLSTQ